MEKGSLGPWPSLIFRRIDVLFDDNSPFWVIFLSELPLRNAWRKNPPNIFSCREILIQAKLTSKEKCSSRKIFLEDKFFRRKFSIGKILREEIFYKKNLSQVIFYKKNCEKIFYSRNFRKEIFNRELEPSIWNPKFVQIPGHSSSRSWGIVGLRRFIYPRGKSRIKNTFPPINSWLLEMGGIFLMYDCDVPEAFSSSESQRFSYSNARFCYVFRFSFSPSLSDFSRREDTVDFSLYLRPQTFYIVFVLCALFTYCFSLLIPLFQQLLLSVFQLFFFLFRLETSNFIQNVLWAVWINRGIISVKILEKITNWIITIEVSKFSGENHEKIFREKQQKYISIENDEEVRNEGAPRNKFAFSSSP